MQFLSNNEAHYYQFAKNQIARFLPEKEPSVNTRSQ